MANRQKQKGDRFERYIVDEARLKGIDAFRVPLSGSVDGFKDDIELRFGRETWRLEAKKRKDGFKQIYGWLGDADALVIGADNKPALVVIDLKDFLTILQAAKGDEYK